MVFTLILKLPTKWPLTHVSQFLLSVFPMMVWVHHIFKKLCVSVGMCLCMFVYRCMYMCACEQLCVCVCAFLCPCALEQRSQEDISHSSLLFFALSLWNSNAPVFWGDSEPAVPVSLRNGVTSSYTDTSFCIDLFYF